MANIEKIERAGGVDRPKAAPRQKNRNGLKGLLTYHRPAVLKQLKLIGIEHDKNQQQLVIEALNGLFIKYGVHPIA
jgi:hypothetical protein